MARVLIGIAATSGDGGEPAEEVVSPIDHFALGWQLADERMMADALAREGWPDYLREWMKARAARRGGRLEEARGAYFAAAERWPPEAEREEIRAVFDRERLAWWLEQDLLAEADGVRQGPLARHGRDPRWAALGAEARRRAGADARAEFDGAWRHADDLEKRDPAFLGRALAHLDRGDARGAGRAWIETVGVLRRPERLRRAGEVWDANPNLRQAVLDDPSTLEPALDWLVGLFRRSEAYEIAARVIDEQSAPPEQLCDLFVFGAEQLYRLRRHDDLARWLDGPYPDGLDREQAAALAAYPWGVRRRTGPSEEIARGFDAVAREFAGTDRAVEAVWEAAWMWELSDRPDTARTRFERYTELSPSGTYAEPAALRAILIPYLAGDPERALAAAGRVSGSLGGGMSGAAALLLEARSLERLGRPEQARAVRDRLRGEHPASPLWRGVPHPWSAPDVRMADPLEVQRKLYATQREAFGHVARHLGLRDPLVELPADLEDLHRLLELGLMEEGEIRLLEFGRVHRGDDALLLRSVAVAWATGSPEIQARLGYLLELRLRDGSPELDRALWAIARPSPYAADVLAISRELGLPAGLVWSLMRRESFYDADVVSLAGAYGLLQLLPTTAARMAEELDERLDAPSRLFAPALNLRYGMGYLRRLIDESGGDLPRALASYNAGESNGARWAARRPPDEPVAFMILQISYSETRAYVHEVLRHWWIGRDAYPVLELWDGLPGS